MDAHLALRFAGSLRDAYRLRYVPAADVKGKRIPGAFATACWMWQTDPTAPHHVITFGEALADQLKRPSDERLSAYAVRYYRHEKAHSLHTERNLKALNLAAQKVGVPFSLINLLEDARIEQLEREAEKQPFEWTTFEGCNTGTSPVGYFLAIIQADGMAKEAKRKLGAGLTKAQAERVRDYYYPASLKCPSTWAILKLAQEWVKEFGVPPQAGKGAKGSGAAGAGAPGEAEGSGTEGAESAGEGKGKSPGTNPGEGTLNPDMEAALAAQLDEAIREAVEVAGSDLGGKDPSPEEKERKAKLFAMGERHSIAVKEFSSADLLTGSTDLDLPLVERLAAMSRRAFPRTQTKITTVSPSKRLNMRNVIRDLDRIYRKKVEGDEIVPMEIVFMLDCSGSMNAASGQTKLSTHDVGCAILAVLSRLAQQGIVKGHAILTAGDGGRAKCQTFALPMTDEQIGKIYSSGDFEGFDSAMRLCASLLKKAALVLAYTDGHITDTRIDKSYWHRHGIYSVGMYCGEPGRAAALSEWFDADLARETPDGLIDALTQILLKWTRARAAA